MEEIIWNELTIKKHISHIIWVIMLIILVILGTYKYYRFIKNPLLQITIIVILSILISWFCYFKWLSKAVKIIYNSNNGGIYTVDFFQNKRNIILITDVNKIIYQKIIMMVDKDSLDENETIEFYDKNDNLIFNHTSSIEMENIIEYIKIKNKDVIIKKIEIQKYR